MIHPGAIVDSGAELAPDVEVGPFSVIGPEVEIDSGTTIGSHVVLEGPTRIGRNNRIHSFASLGGAPQDMKYRGESSRLEIGDDNVIREYCTFNRGTEPGGMLTRIGNRNWIMAYVHIAHDCRLGNGIVMANAASIAGHVEIEDDAILGGFSTVRQFCRIGTGSFLAMTSCALKDIPPFITAAGNPASPRGLNSEGLKRRGVPKETVRSLKSAYHTVYRQGLTVDDAIGRLADLAADIPQVERFCAFVRQSKRGIVRERGPRRENVPEDASENTPENAP